MLRLSSNYRLAGTLDSMISILHMSQSTYLLSEAKRPLNYPTPAPCLMPTSAVTFGLKIL